MQSLLKKKSQAKVRQNLSNELSTGKRRARDELLDRLAIANSCLEMLHERWNKELQKQGRFWTQTKGFFKCGQTEQGIPVAGGDLSLFSIPKLG